MGDGIDAARAEAPEHTRVLDNLKDQLLIVLINRLGGEVSIPVAEIDDSGVYTCSFNVVDRVFNFQTNRKH